ncbi:MAG: DUF3048 domain-containing protein [Firmicutes bacterium]|nr:DUF3048 domain-containing protein [Bacillota bacterium]
MKRLFIVLVCFAVASLSGCKKKEAENTPDTSQTNVQNENKEEKKEEIEKKEEKDPHEGMEKSVLTGEYVEAETSKLRPYAVVINNLHKALPQSGIEQADLYYEVLAEGEITRIVAIFQNFDAEKIGPVRSARDYFTYFALDNNAIFVHHGGSETGYAAVRNRGLNNIDGMTSGAFWRDQTRLNTPGMYEHSSYTDAESLKKEAGDKNFSQNFSSEYSPMFSFYELETELTGSAAEARNVKLPYSSYQVSEFVYDENTRLYGRIQSGQPQIDDATGNQLKVKNIIIQKADMWIIPGDNAGRREVEIVGSGTGTFVTNGKARDITWEKKSYDSPTKWFDEKGNELKLNAGKTWICVFPKNAEYTME